jgi:inosine-uridine nucleoside N-ribohydrolase
LAPSASAAERSEPVRLVFDTDIGNDIDDALALGVIHALQSRGECELLAVVTSKSNEYCAPFVSLVNNFYGRPEIPIGIVGVDGKTPEPSRFLQELVGAQETSGAPRYPRNIATYQNASPAVLVLRRALAAQPEQSVVIATVGFSTNLKLLLESPADEWSPLAGKDLVARKCKLLSIMAGMYSETGRHKEYNVFTDAPAARAVYADWPSPIVASGFEIGLAIKFPAESIVRDFNYVPHHPLREAYELYQAMPYDRETWDLTSVLHAVRPDRGYFDLSDAGTIAVDDDHITQFAPNPEGRHRYLKVNAEQIVRVREALVQLASQPPTASRRNVPFPPGALPPRTDPRR